MLIAQRDAKAFELLPMHQFASLRGLTCYELVCNKLDTNSIVIDLPRLDDILKLEVG